MIPVVLTQFPYLTSRDEKHLAACVNLEDPALEGVVDPLIRIGTWFARHPEMASLLQHDHEHHVATSWHCERLVVHLLATGMNAYLLARRQEQSELICRVCFYAGFFHDIGKPLARVGRGKACFYTGHAQLGTQLLTTLLPEIDLSIGRAVWHDMAWVCNHHMCCYSQQRMHCQGNYGHGDSDTTSLTSALVRLTCPTDHQLYLLSVVSEADQASRISDRVEPLRSLGPLPERGEDAIQVLCTARRITNQDVIVVMLGPSGSGKSTTAAHLKMLCQDHAWSYLHVERDMSLRTVYQTLMGHDSDVPYLTMYQAVSDYVSPSGEAGRALVQKHWITELSDALESKATVTIIDTVQTLYTPWQQTLSALSEEAQYRWHQTLKVAYYGLPLHWQGITYTPKTGSYATYPLTSPSASFPLLTMEKNEHDPTHLDYGSGSLAMVTRVMTTWLTGNGSGRTFIPICEQQRSALACVRALAVHEDPVVALCQQFPKGIVYTQTEMSVPDTTTSDTRYNVRKLLYLDGQQIFTGPTRDYRGEMLLETRRPGEPPTYDYLRPSMPIFPDWVTIDRDTETQHRLTSPAPSQGYVACPKYDGSMFNLLVVPKSHSLSHVITCLSQQAPQGSYYDRPDAHYVLGSKATCFCKDPVLKRIHKAIPGSYASIEVFLDHVRRFLDQNGFDRFLVTLHFEAIDQTPTPELTVQYTSNQCVFLGLTYVDMEDTKYFRVPSQLMIESLVTVSCTRLDTWDEVETYMEDQYQELLQGSMHVEPEGYVVHVLVDGQWITAVKYKYRLYYAAHKPESRLQREYAEKLQLDSTFALVRERLVRFRTVTPLAELLRDTFDQLKEWAQTSSTLSLSVKEYYLSLQSDEVKQRMTRLGDEITSVTALHYPGLRPRPNILGWLMKIYKDRTHDSVTDDSILSYFNLQ